jgi:DNA-directed RNA polymerase specialized sigma24 family protein
MTETTLTPAQFDALAQLLRLRESKGREAARMVLVDGVSPAEAARALGILRSNAYTAVYACRRGIELARVVTRGQ